VLEALGNVGDFIGGIAVVVTLIYLAVQVRQNTNALRTASRQAIASGYRETNRLKLDPKVGAAWSRGVSAFPDLPFDERHLFSTVMTDEALFFQGAFALHESGQLDDSTYLAYLAWFSSIIVTPGGRFWWETTGRPIFTPGMIVAVDERVAQGKLVDIRGLPGLGVDAPSAGDRS
jgi:hypothetical protein